MAHDKISLSEFLNLTKMRKGELITLLENGDLPVMIGPTREVLIDLSNMSPEAFAQRPLTVSSAASDDENLIYAEVVGAELTAELDSILDDALDLALNWLQKGRPTDDASE